MKLSIPQAGIGKASVQKVSVGEVKLGPVHIGRLNLKNLHVDASTGTALMRNVKVVLNLKFGLDWKVGVTIDMPFPLPDIDFSEHGTLDLGALRLGVGFGDLTLPGLADFTLDVPSLPVNDLSAVIGALKNLNLGAALAERIKAQGLSGPKQGFQVNGLGLGGFNAQGINLPDAAMTGATVGRISGGTLPLAGLSIPGIAFPQVTLPAVSCRNVGATSNELVKPMPTVDVGLLQATLTVTVTADFHMDELRVEGVKAAASIGEVALTNVQLPYEILDLTLSQIGIECVEVPQVEVK